MRPKPLTRNLWFFCVTALSLAACASKPITPVPQRQSVKPFFTNDASAPLDTPLCGVAAREQNAMEAAIYGSPYTSGNGCVQNACFSPLTASFIAATGYRSICR